MLDHTGIVVSDLNRSQAFYSKSLQPLAIGLVAEVTAEQTGAHAHAGFGIHGKPFFWISSGARRSGPAHFAFAATSRAAVDAFHRAALAAGGKDNGAPGLRTHYHPHYYGAFVLDPDGNNIEAVCHASQ